MSAHCDFVEQVQSGEAKPDMIVKLPGDRMIVVDAKVPDLEGLGHMDQADPAQRKEQLAHHVSKLKLTIRQLADRHYPEQFPQALDHVILFMPAESLFSAALEADQDLIVWAAERKILLATPTSLIALLRSVSVSWKQHAQTENAGHCPAAEELTDASWYLWIIWIKSNRALRPQVVPTTKPWVVTSDRFAQAANACSSSPSTPSQK